MAILSAFLKQTLTVVIGESWKARLTGKSLVVAPYGKGLLQSKTFYGVLMMALPVVLGWFGLTLADAQMQLVAEQIVQIVGAVLAVYGRIKASEQIGEE